MAQTTTVQEQFPQPPKVSVIIPSFDGKRGGNLNRLKEQLAGQTLPPHEIVVVVGVSPNGRARNEGVKKASGDYYVFIDDDVTLGDNRVIENLISPFSEPSQHIGMTGPSQLLPDNSTWLQRAAARQLPRSDFPVQKELVDSDMVTHMCLCMPAQLFKDVGWENPDIIAGTDPDLRHRVREAGYRVCVVPNTWAYHPMPETLLKILRLSYIKGRNSAKVRKSHPELVLELDNGFKKTFAARRSLAFRVFRTLGIFLWSILTLKFIQSAATIAYATGNMVESCRR